MGGAPSWGVERRGDDALNYGIPRLSNKGLWRPVATRLGHSRLARIEVK